MQKIILKGLLNFNNEVLLHSFGIELRIYDDISIVMKSVKGFKCFYVFSYYIKVS